jgi:hypothetical protein
MSSALRWVSLLVVHSLTIYFLVLLWKEKNKALDKGALMTRIGYVSKKKSPRLFYFSVWVDFIVMMVLYIGLVMYTICLLGNL